MSVACSISLLAYLHGAFVLPSIASQCHPLAFLRLPLRDTHVVSTGTQGNSEGSDGTDWSANAEGVSGSDSDLSVGNTCDEEGGVGSVGEVSGCTVEFSEEDEEKGKGSSLGEVSVGSDGALQTLLVLGVLGGSLVLAVTDGASLTRAEHDARLDAVGDDVGGQVGVVACEQSRVGQRGRAKRRSMEEVMGAAGGVSFGTWRAGSVEVSESEAMPARAAS